VLDNADVEMLMSKCDADGELRNARKMVGRRWPGCWKMGTEEGGESCSVFPKRGSQEWLFPGEERASTDGDEEKLRSGTAISQASKTGRHPMKRGAVK
jgi:hypothetical protein